MTKHLVLAIDEEGTIHDHIRDSLQKIYGVESEVIVDFPQPSVEEMIEKIQLFGDRLGALVFDERLAETGECDYEGSRLAEAYRAYDAKIPIYILTSYANSDGIETGNIEYVIDKGDLIVDAKIDMLKQRLRRHLDISVDIVDGRVNRLDELIKKQISDSLSESEVKELGQLQFWRSRAVELEDSLFSEKLKANLDEKEKALSELETLLNKGN